MFAKTALERVDDTVDYLATTAVVEAQYRRAAKAMIEMFLNSQHPNFGGAAFNQMSNELSLGARPAGQLTVPRQQARAIYLLWKAMHWIDPITRVPFANVAAIPQLNIADVLEYTIYKALMVYDAKSKSTFAARQVLEHVLARDTRRFLMHNHLLIRGSTHRPPPGAGNQNVVRFSFFYDPGGDKFVIQEGTAGGDKHQFDAASISATLWTDVNGRGNSPNIGSFAQIDPIEVGGSRIVVTTQFTGCSLCLRQHGGRLFAAHISPGNPRQSEPVIGTGNVLARQLCGIAPPVVSAGFTNAPGAVLVYGREHSNIQNAVNGYGGPNLDYFTMIGFDNGAGWKLYAQDNQVGGAITNVRQIFP
jgi:hypothetical protein